MVRLIFVGYFREKIGVKEIEVRLKGETTFRELIEKYVSENVREIFGDDENYDDVIILVNGNSLDYLGGFNAKIRDSDIIHFIPFIGGG